MKPAVRAYRKKIVPPAEMETLVERVREAFVIKPQNFLVCLLERFLSKISLNADIVLGINSFDPVVFLTMPLVQATYCFYDLYHSFNLRRRLNNTSETEARDEYFDHLDYIRKTYSELSDIPEIFADMVAFLLQLTDKDPGFSTELFLLDFNAGVTSHQVSAGEQWRLP